MQWKSRKDTVLYFYIECLVNASLKIYLLYIQLYFIKFKGTVSEKILDVIQATFCYNQTGILF